jgi:hypothetical protein
MANSMFWGVNVCGWWTTTTTTMVVMAEPREADNRGNRAGGRTSDFDDDIELALHNDDQTIGEKGTISFLALPACCYLPLPIEQEGTLLQKVHFRFSSSVQGYCSKCDITSRLPIEITAR